ncbi:MAG: ATP-binding protein [archaeon]|nr:ATP-binding protein [archaeon]
MDCFITYCIKGFIAFDENFKIIGKKLFLADEIPVKVNKINNRELLAEEIQLIEEVSQNYDNIFIETTKLASDYSSLKEYEKIQIETPNKGGEYLRSHLEEMEFFNEEELIDFHRKLSILKMKEASKSEDKHLIQAINSIDEIDESISKLIERIREWYALYFPEMDIIKNNETYIKLISENKTKEEVIKAKPSAFLDEITDFDEEIAPEDLEIINNFANSIYELQKTRKDTEEYIENKMEAIAPNLKLLVGSTLGAKLIAHARGVKRLAIYSASTVQIMGAEKALFRHLKTGDNPPKYGLIYQHPQIRGAKWWNRGKIAKMLSSKITMAIRRDVFTKTFNENCYDEFIEKAEAIEKENPFQPTRPKKNVKKPEKGKKGKRKGKKKRKNKKRR